MAAAAADAASTTDRGGDDVDPLPGAGGGREAEGGESACSTPFVSAPSSPARDAPSSFPYHGACFFSAPTSPTRGGCGMGMDFDFDFDFDFSSRFPSPSAAAMSSADELFHNGQIRPVPRLLLSPEPLPSLAMEPAEAASSGGDRGRVRGAGGGHHRKSRSLSPFSRAGAAHWRSRPPAPEPEEEEAAKPTTPLATPAASRSSSSSSSASSSSSSSSSRSSSSKRWGFIKDLLLNRSKSDGGKPTTTTNLTATPEAPQKRSPSSSPAPAAAAKARGRGGRRRTAHERLYEARRAEAEEMRRRTYLPYRQGGLLFFGCIGLGGAAHRSGAVHGLARAAAVSSRS